MTNNNGVIGVFDDILGSLEKAGNVYQSFREADRNFEQQFINDRTPSNEPSFVEQDKDNEDKLLLIGGVALGIVAIIGVGGLILGRKKS